MSPFALDVALSVGISLVAGGAWLLLVLLARWGLSKKPAAEPEKDLAGDIPIPEDGKSLGFEHPCAWPVVIVKKTPYAVGPHGIVQWFGAASERWWTCREGDRDATEARERVRLRSLEDTQVDDDEFVHPAHVVWDDSTRKWKRV